MSTEIDEFRQSLVAAVQAELERHANAVVAEVDRLRDEGRRERADLRADFNHKLQALTQMVEQVQQRPAAADDRSLKAIEQRLTDLDARQTRRLDEATAGLEGMVQTAMRPALNDVRDDQEALVRKVDALDGNLRKFDEQAARMVTFFNDTTTRMEQRQEELGETLQADVATRIEHLKQLVDDNDSTVRRFQNEVGQSVSQKINDAEDRFNNRLLASESRVKEDAGQKIAEIDAHVGRVSNGLDEALQVVNDRISDIDTRLVEMHRRIDGLEESMEGLDSSELDDLKEKMSTAAGEAMLVRIEMERMEKAVAEKTDGLAIRLTEAETQLQDATMDVSTAIQMDRLEEVERALMEIDPTQFVRRSELGADARPNQAPPPPPTGTGSMPPPPPSSQETLKNPEPLADESGGIDVSAIIAAEEDR